MHKQNKNRVQNSNGANTASPVFLRPSRIDRSNALYCFLSRGQCLSHLGHQRQRGPLGAIWRESRVIDCLFFVVVASGVSFFPEMNCFLDETSTSRVNQPHSGALLQQSSRLFKREENGSEGGGTTQQSKTDPYSFFFPVPCMANLVPGLIGYCLKSHWGSFFVFFPSMSN